MLLSKKGKEGNNIPYRGDDSEAIENISRNIMQVALMQKERNAENEIKKEKFLDQITKLFKFVNRIEKFISEDNESSSFLDPDSITASIELVADASNFNKIKMAIIRKLLIWRLNSYSKGREVINDLTFKYIECFWDCYDEHYEKVLEDEQLLKYSMMGMQSQASTSFADYIQSKLAPAFFKKRKEMNKMLADKDKKKDTIM